MKKKPTKLRAVKELPDNPDYMIHVDRTVIPVYPEFVQDLVYPGRECEGPTDFDLSKLNRVLNLQDGLAIKHKPRLFKKFFSVRRIPLGNSIVKDIFGNFFVPRIHEENGYVVIEWFHISYECLNYPWLWVVRPNL